MRKRYIFLILMVCLFVFLFLADFKPILDKHDFFHELFWLFSGTIFTTFLLEKILSNEEQKRRFEADHFAFRSFVGFCFIRLLEIVDGDQKYKEQISKSVFDIEHYEAKILEVSEVISSAKTFNPELYRRNYLDIQSELRLLARNYIRLFSNSKEEMLLHFLELMDLAKNWNYKSDLPSENEILTDQVGDIAIDQSDESMLQAQSSMNLTVETAGFLALLVSKAMKRTSYFGK